MRKSLLLAALAACAGLVSSAATVHAAGRMIAIDSSRAIYEIDIATGAKTLIGTASSNASTTGGLAYDRATGTLYLTSTGNDSLYTLDLATGNATLVGAYGADVVMHGLEYDDSTGQLYGGSNGNLFNINKLTGAATQIGATGLTSFLNLGYNPVTNTMYGASTLTPDTLFVMNRTTGAATPVGPLAPSTNPNGLAFNTDNGLMYMIDNTTDTLYTLDLATGVPTAVGSTGTGNLLGLAYVSEIPEPASLAGLALAGLLALRRR